VKEANKSLTKLGRITFASDGSAEGIFSRHAVGPRIDEEEGQEIDQDGVPQNLLVVGYEPTEDCSLLSEYSPLFMQATSKKGKFLKH
jgi:hypothetical protein